MVACQLLQVAVAAQIGAAVTDVRDRQAAAEHQCNRQRRACAGILVQHLFVRAHHGVAHHVVQRIAAGAAADGWRNQLAQQRLRNAADRALAGVLAVCVAAHAVGNCE